MASKAFRYQPAADHVEWTQRQQQRINKKYSSKGLPVYVLRKQVMTTACSVAGKIAGAASIELAPLLPESADVSPELISLYEAQLALALSDRQKFADGLFEFYLKTAKQLVKDGTQREFARLLGCFLCRKCASNEETPVRTFLAAIDLLQRQLSFLRADRFDYNQLVCGFTSAGEAMTRKEPFRSLDIPTFELEQAIAELPKGTKLEGNDRLISEIYGRHGLREVTTYQQMEVLQVVSRIYAANLAAMAQWVDEESSEILPAVPLQMIFFSMQWPQMGDKLETLPVISDASELPARLVLEFSGSSMYRRLLLRKQGDALLYRLTTAQGEASGWYDPAAGSFYSPLVQAEGAGAEVHEILEALLAWAASCAAGQIAPGSYREYFDDTIGATASAAEEA